ncbi:uncharacterized protein [Maniola hyperantus]|uniref:uncharacterized protein n=1 Tax=Aphantopus hyperantus TaxID=2795564 RepID=UPI0015699EC4|nr:uncharacterized protein LOC117993943 [Maniola hyperantus]
MTLMVWFTALALFGFLAAAATSNDDADMKVITRDTLYPKHLIKYKAEHDIVKLVVPLNALNLVDDIPPLGSSGPAKESSDILFFVEADILPDGSRVDQGLYVRKEGKVTKILDYGRDAAASGLWDNSTKAFFGAKGGLYVYILETNSADKYGPITDSIIAIDMERFGEVIYILTEDLKLYKVTNGEKKEKLEDVVKPEQIVLDFQNNLYFFSDDKVPYVRTADGVKKIEGLPKATGTVTLYKPPLYLENGALVIINNKVYIMYPNATSEAKAELEPGALPTAVAVEGQVFQYYAHDKKIYQYKVQI